VLEWVGFVVGVAGLSPTVVILLDRLRDQVPTRRVLDFRRRNGIDILVTTSFTGISTVGPPDGPRARRDLVPAGDLAGVVQICALLTRVYPGRPFVITPSSLAQDDPRRDQVLVGGPVHNRYTAQLVCGTMGDASDDTPIVFDANARFVKMRDRTWGPGLDLRFENDLPQVEYAMVLLTSIRRYGTSQRVVVTTGMTTYGTHAAGHFVAHELTRFLTERRAGRAPAICILVKAALVNGQPYDFTVVHSMPVDQMGGWS